MKIMYIHGFGSSYNPESDKIKQLGEIGEVVGMSYDYTAGSNDNVFELKKFACDQKVDLIVGTSLGGWYAAKVGSELGIPAVMINPAINPVESLIKYVGTNTDWYGNEYILEQSIVDTYSLIDFDACGLVLIDRGDNVIDPRVTDETLAPYYDVISFAGGSHQFDHMEQALDDITDFYMRAQLVYSL